MPDLTSTDGSCVSAVLAYAAAGLFALPVRRGSKNPGSVVGSGWPVKSTRDPEVIVSLWAGTDYGIALHMDRSGVVAIDVDRPELVSTELRTALHIAPFQSSDPHTSGRGHYLFRQPQDGPPIGNSSFPWGEVRGRNGVIIVAPSQHARAADGAEYRWVRSGEIRDLPQCLNALLTRSADVAVAAAPGEQVEQFLDAHNGGADLLLFDKLTRVYRANVDSGRSRHGSMCAALASAMKEARLGNYPARHAEKVLRGLFVADVTQPGVGPHQGAARDLSAAREEYRAMLAWAVGQALAADLPEVQARVDRLTAADLLGTVAPPMSELSADARTSTAPAADVTPGALDAVVVRRAQLLAQEVERLEIRDEARAVVEARKEAARPPRRRAQVVTVRQVLAQDPEPAHRVDGLIPADASTLIVGQRKAGKTTLIMNLVDALLSGAPFLGRLDVRALTGDVAVMNYEVSGRTLARWCADHGVDRDRVHLVNLRGHPNPLADPDDRAALAAELRRLGVETVVVDPFGRAFSGQSQNDAGEVTAFLTGLDTFARSEVGAADLILTTHAGWDGGRSRGSSGLEDWPDSIVTLTANDQGVRFLRAIGRDVELDEDALTYDAATRRLTLSGAGVSRKAHAAANRQEKLTADLLAVVDAHPGMNIAALETHLREHGVHFQKGDVSKAVGAARNAGQVYTVDGPGNAKQVYPSQTRALAS